MKFVLDTSAYSAFYRGDKRLRRWISPKHEIIVPQVVVGELRAGFLCGSRPAENERLLQRFLDASNVRLVSLSDETTRRFAEIFAQLRSAGKALGTNDIWIAATAREHDCSLLSLDAGFAHVAGLRRVKV